MNNEQLLLNGQHEKEDQSSVNTMAANDAIAESGLSDTSDFMSSQIKSMITAPDFRHSDPYMSEREIQRRSGQSWIDSKNFAETHGLTYSDKGTSDTLTIAKDAVKRFGLQMLTYGDKAEIVAGQLLSKLSGGTIGEEMQKRAYDIIDSRMAEIGRTYENKEDLNTVTAEVVGGAASMLEMFAASMATGGIAPLVQVGLDAMGGGTYNNMRRYADEHGGSIEGFEGNWNDIAIDMANAGLQAYIEKKLGFGKKEWLERFGKSTWFKNEWDLFAKQTASGSLQEGFQAYFDDLTEYLKGNADAPNNWAGYLRTAIIAGPMQGALATGVHKFSRVKADNELSDMIVRAKMTRNPNANLAQVKKDAQAIAKKFNDDVENDSVKGMWDELANRIDANNDRGVVRDNLVKEFTKARVAALGLESAEDLDAEDLSDIQDAATVAAGEAFRESFIMGVPIEQTVTARLTADGKDLMVRDLQESERGIREMARLDLDAEAQQLAERMAAGREKAEQRRRETEEKIRQARLDADIKAREDSLAELEAWAAQQVKLGEEIGRRREKGQTAISKKEIDRWLKQSARSEQSRKREEAKTKQISQRMLELGKKKRSDGYTVKEIESNIRSAKDSELQDFVRRIYGYNTRRFGRGMLVDLALNQKNQWTYIKRDKRDSLKLGEQLGRMRQSRIEREMDQQDKWLANYSGVPLSVISNMTDAEYKEFSDKMIAKYAAEEEAKQPQYTEEQLAEFDNIPFQQSLNAIVRGVVENQGRGAYDMRYQRIILNKDSDVSTILHELSHMWLNNWFKAYRSENAPESFRKWWRPVERALGIRESDRFLDQDASEKFARSFEKWVLDGGKGSESSLTPVFERLSKRLADIYDDLATRYFDMVGDLKPEVQSWFAKNEVLADSMVVDVPERNEETGEETTEQVRVQMRDRAEERKNAMADAKLNDDVERAAAQLDRSLQQENLEPSGKMREHDTSRSVRDRLSTKGILDGYRNTYDQESTLEVAEKVRDYVAINPDEAFEVAMGRKNAPDDLPATMVYTAVTNYLDSRGDVARLWELQQSPIVEYRANIARELQRGRDFFRDGNNRPDIPRIIKYMNKAYENRMTETDKEILQKEVLTINELIDKADLNFEDAWNKILSDMECK